MRVTLPSLLALAACAHPTPPATPIVAPAPVALAPAPTVPAARPPIDALVPAAAPAIVPAYDQPPKAVLDVLHAPSPPQPYLSPTRETILLVSWVDYPSITQIAEPFLRLAGVRVEPRTRRKHDTAGGYGVAPCARSFTLVDVATSKEIAVPLPAGGCADGIAWAADGKRFVFRNTAADAVELWVADAAGGSARRVGDLRLDPMLGSSHQWLPDQKSLLVKLVPDKAGPAPGAGTATVAPSIQETTGEKGQFSTYEARDTLTNKHDEALFEYYGTSQLAVVDVATGAVQKLGAPAVYAEVDASPDGQHVLVTTIDKPYSYVVTVDRFAHTTAIWDRAGKVEKVLAKLPVADRVPVHGVPTGLRDASWRFTAGTEPAAIYWAEALDGGDWNAKVPARDKVMMLRAPFTGAAVEVARTEQRFEGFEFGERGAVLMHELDENRHWNRTFVVNLDDPKQKPRVLFDLSSDEKYKDPGTPLYRVQPNGSYAMRQDGDAIFLRGTGASPDGDRPFLDRLDLKTAQTTRLFRSERTGLETAINFSAKDDKAFLTWHQSVTDPPNAFLRTLGGPPIVKPAPGEAAVASSAKPITHVPDPTPAVRAIKKRLVKYKRKDGLELSFTLYTPPNYQEGTRVPAILYAYPLDYADAKAAGQVTGSDQRFTTLRDYRLLLLSGYAIIDNAAFPIVGDPKKAYDTYLTQLVDDAKAAVDKAVELGVDRDRIGVTGHSHGALMTVNLLAHTDLFRAGVATSGSYNKTLTPFGFQSERRSVWEAPKVYTDVSPFFVADKLKRPLLIMHGAEDANPGTTPLQAVKLYEALRGNGGIARLVMLPHEPHWYSAMESNEQLAFEEIRWFDKYVKNAAKK